MRRIAKEIHPRLIITENNGNWTIRAETAIKTKKINFTPSVEFDDVTIDGREAKVSFCLKKKQLLKGGVIHIQSIVHFQNGKWVQKLVDKKGMEGHVTRFVDGDGLHEVGSNLSFDYLINHSIYFKEILYGSTKASRLFKRVN